MTTDQTVDLQALADKILTERDVAIDPYDVTVNLLFDIAEINYALTGERLDGFIPGDRRYLLRGLEEEAQELVREHGLDTLVALYPVVMERRDALEAQGRGY